MGIKRLAWLLSVSLLLNLAIAFWVRAPGYMDSEYYFSTAQRVASGEGWTEPYLWNYLDDPEGIPHPSHQYWMPLTTLLAAVPMLILGESFRAAQLSFLLIASALPILTALFAYRLHGNVRWAFQAGFFALFSGFFMPYLITSDTFGVYAMLGGTSMWLLGRAMQTRRRADWLCLGVLAGMAHLARADGVLFLVLAWVALAWSKQDLAKGSMWLVLGYAGAMFPWFVRNLIVSGHALPSAAGRTLWLRAYNELYAYPAGMLTPARWWQAGMGEILRVRWQALWVNIQRLIAENGLIFLGPFMILGAKSLWSKNTVRLAALYLAMLLLVMSVVFPFAGSYGGFFHSSIAVMPVLWALAPVGLHRAIAWLSVRRAWKGGAAQIVLGNSAILLAALLSVYFVWDRAVGPAFNAPRWENSFQQYRLIGEELDGLEAGRDVVAVNNPPGFFLATGFPAVVIPDGDLQVLQQVVRRYNVTWIILDANRPEGLSALFELREIPAWMELTKVVENPGGGKIEIFRVTSSEASQG